MRMASQRLVKRFMAQQAAKLEYNSEAAAEIIKNLKDIPTHSD